MLVARRDPEQVLDVLLLAFHPIARAMRPMTRLLIDIAGGRVRTASRRRPMPTRQLRRAPAAEEEEGRGGHFGRGRTRAAAVDRRFHRDGRARGDDAASRHHCDSRGRDAHRAADALPRGAVLANSRLSQGPRQHHRHRLRQGSRGAAAWRRAAADDADAVGVHGAGEQARVGAAEGDAAPAGADGDRRRRVRRDRGPGDGRGSARGDRRRNPRRVRRGERDGRPTRATARSSSAER